MIGVVRGKLQKRPFVKQSTWTNLTRKRIITSGFFWDDGQNVEAEKLLRRATQLDPNSYCAHGRLGMLLYEQGRYSEAESEFRRTVEINPSDTGARFYLCQMPGSAAGGPGVSN